MRPSANLLMNVSGSWLETNSTVPSISSCLQSSWVADLGPVRGRTTTGTNNRLRRVKTVRRTSSLI